MSVFFTYKQKQLWIILVTAGKITSRKTGFISSTLTQDQTV